MKAGGQLRSIELAKRGVGICIVMDEVGDAQPRVRRVLPELRPLPVPVWLATHRELHTSRRILLASQGA